MNPNIFRQYDIRGVVKTDLTDEVITDIGRGFGTYLASMGYRSVTIGRDNRHSSRGFRDAIISGLVSTGCNVTDLGLIPTPLLYFSLYHLKPNGGVMITGSHNPPEFNGFKLCVGKTSIYGEEIQNIRKIIESRDFASGKGSVSEFNIVRPYIQFVKEKIAFDRKDIRVVVDAGNGTAGIIAPLLLRAIGCEVKELYCNLDGSFPNHFPDPTIEENLNELRKVVISNNADIGIAYDGDADRIGVVDEKGNIIWGDHLMILFAREIIKKRPGAKIIFEVKCSQNLHDEIIKYGGVPIMWKTGHSLIKEKMHTEKALLAGEMSGHIFFADNYLGYDDAIYASCRIIQILSNSTVGLYSMLSNVPKVYSTPEIRVECPDEDKFSIVDELRDYFKDRYNVIDIDGVRIIFEDGWALVRASNTQPVLVLRFEAKSEARLRELKDMVLDRVGDYPSVKVKKE